MEVCIKMSQIEIPNLQQLADALEECQIYEDKPSDIVLHDPCDTSIQAMFPKPKPNIPPVFLHKPVKFSPLMHKVLNLGIKFYRPIVGQHYTRILCPTSNDHKALIEFFQSKQLPYHTFGYPDKRKMKVVLRGLPKDVDLDHLKRELELRSIPIVRIHKMKNKERAKDRPLLVLVIVPNDDNGRRILQVQRFLDHNIEIESLKSTNMQCYRCQKWGHAQRYCYGQVKCVKCAGDHLSQECTRDPARLPPKCANCRSDHTSSYKLCPFSPYSPQYLKKMSASVINKAMFPHIQMPKKLVTLNNCHLFLRGRI